MSETSDILPSGTEADLQEQGTPVQSGDATDGPIAGDGTGGSEADRQEQAAPVGTGEDAVGGGITGDGTGGSEADRLEQAAVVPVDGEDAFPHAGTDEDPTTGAEPGEYA